MGTNRRPSPDTHAHPLHAPFPPPQQAIANRELKTLEVELDDLASVSFGVACVFGCFVCSASS